MGEDLAVCCIQYCNTTVPLSNINTQEVVIDKPSDKYRFTRYIIFGLNNAQHGIK